MHGSSIQVVGVEVVKAFTACRCLLCVVNADLGMPFHDLSDSSSQVLQQLNEVIDLIQMSITLLNHSYLLIYQVINILNQRIIVCRNTSCSLGYRLLSSLKQDVINEFMASDIVVFSVT